MLPLTTADLLAHAIVGSVLENLDMERLINEVGHAVAQRILGNNESVDDVARELHEKLLLRNESTKKVVIESIYKDIEEARHNVAVFSEAPTLAAARPLLKKVKWQSLSSSSDIDCGSGAWDTLHGQVSPSPGVYVAEQLLVCSGNSSSFPRSEGSILTEDCWISSSQSRDRLCRIRCACQRQRLWDCCGVVTFLSCWRKSCLWWDAKRSLKGCV